MPNKIVIIVIKNESAFNQNERGKKASYNQRVIDIEHGSFSPIVMSAFGGCGKETERVLSKLVIKLSEKRDVPNSIMANYVRTKLSFELIKSQVMCIRDSRKLWSPKLDVGEAEVVQCVGRIRE